MKRMVFALIFINLLIGLPSDSQASTVVRTGETVSIKSDEKVMGHFYALAGTVSIAGEVDGDVLAAAGTVSITTPVTDDILVAGGTVMLQASTTGDVRVLGGDVTIAGPVEGSVFIVGGRVKILSTADVKGDVFFAGGELVLEGNVSGQLLGVAESVRVDATVEKGLDMQVVSLTLGEQAVINGDVIYTSDNELVRSIGATVSGTITRSDHSKATTNESDNSYREMAMGFLVSLFASLSLYAVARGLITKILQSITENPLRDALLGFGVILFVPVLIVILTVSVLGLFLGLISLALFVLLLVLAIPLLNMTIGLILAHTFAKNKELNILFITIGACIVQGLLLIPIVGIVCLIFAYTATVGALLLGLYRLLKTT